MKLNDNTVCGCLTNRYQVFGDAWDVENFIYGEVSSSCDLKSNFTLANSLFSAITKSYYARGFNLLIIT